MEIKKNKVSVDEHDNIVDMVSELPMPKIIANEDGSYSFEGNEETIFIPRDELKKKLKALEIIRKHTTPKGIHIDFNEFMDIFGQPKQETMEEYKLLKEVLK